MEENKLNIDESIKKLEEINNRLSASDITLEESIKLYNEGMILAKDCEEQLKGVEKELKIVNPEDIPNS